MQTSQLSPHSITQFQSRCSHSPRLVALAKEKCKNYQNDLRYSLNETVAYDNRGTFSVPKNV
jgi:hypothetical protein